MSTGVHEVWARIAWAAVDLAREVELDADDVLAGLPFDADTLRRRKRIAWDDYVVIVERIAAAAGGARELEDLLAGSYHQVIPELRAIAGALVSPRAFVHWICDVITPMVFPVLASSCEDLDGGVVLLRQELRPGARPCHAFFEGTTGTFRGLTAHLGLPLIEVLSIDVSPTHGEWRGRLPASRTLATRVRGAARALVARIGLGAEPDGTLIYASIGLDAEPAAQRLELAARDWKLTPRQLDVLEHVVAGLSNKEIAERLSCAENTVELHVTRVLRKADVTSRSQLVARFWSEPTWGFPP